MLSARTPPLVPAQVGLALTHKVQHLMQMGALSEEQTSQITIGGTIQTLTIIQLLAQIPWGQRKCVGGK